MSRIPAIATSPRVSRSGPAAPGPDVSAAGMQGRAFSQMGQSLMQAGQQVGGILKELEDKRRKADLQDYGDTRAFEFRQNLQEFQLNLKAEAEGTDHRDFAVRTQEFIEQQKKDLTEGETDGEKVKYFEDMVRNTVQKTVLDSSGYEFSKRSEHFMSKRLERVDQLQSMFYQNPDPFAASEELVIQMEELNAQRGLLFTNNQVDTLQRAARERVREGVIMGQVRDGLNGIVSGSMTPEEAKASIQSFLKGEAPGTDELMRDMSSKEYATFETRLLNSLNNNQNVALAAAKDRTKNAVSVLGRMDQLNPDLQREITQTRLQIQNLPPSDDKTRLMTALDNAEVVAEFNRGLPQISNRTLLNTSIDDIIPMSGLDNADINLQSREAIQNSIMRSIQERNKDGAAYVAKHFPTLSEDPSSSLEQQRALGIPNPRVLPKDVSANLSAAILEETSPRIRTSQINNILAQYGDKYGHQVLSELAEDNSDFSRAYVFSTYLGDSNTQEKVVRAMMSPDLSKNFDSTFGAPMRNALKENIRRELQQPLTAFYKAGMDEMAGQFQDMVYKTAMYNQLQGNGGNVGRDTAREIVGRNFDFVNTDKGTAILPKTSGADATVVSSFMDQSLRNPDFLREVGINPSRYTAVTGQSDDEFFKTFQRDSFWTMSPSGDGLLLMAEDPTTGMAAPVRSNEGTPIQVPYSEMEQLPFVKRGRR